ncbi:methyl-accepting chemotaxis protein [uncultured Gammaproteobacteria bacterium]
MSMSGGVRQSRGEALVGTGLVSVLILLVAALTVGTLCQRAVEREGMVLSALGERASGLELFVAEVANLQQKMMLFSRDNTPAKASEVIAALQDFRAKVVTVGSNATAPASLEAAEDMIAALDGYGGEFKRVTQEKIAPGIALLGLEVRTKQINDLIQAGLHDTTQMVGTSRTEQRKASTSALLMLGLIMLAIVIGMGLAWLARSKFSQLATEIDVVTGNLGHVFTALAEGDLTQKLEIKQRGAFQKIADEVNATIEKLAGMFVRINGAAQTIADAAGEVAAGGADLAERTERQAASLEQSAAALEQLAGTVKACSERAREANGVVSQAHQAGENGVAVVALAIKAMERIVEASDKIKGIIRLTEGMSRRINMVALNASVEAARAGEAGKGFGVVAREISSLAERSAYASQQIREQITSSDKQIQQGSRMVIQSGEALQTIMTSVDRAAELFQDIAHSTAAQANMLQEINVAITHMDETTQMNAALSEQTCAASLSMRQESRGMKELVSFFMLDGDTADNKLGRHIVLIESTKLDHTSFMKRIHEVIAGQRETAPKDVPGHHQCRLGKWYDSIKLPAIRLNSVYRALERPHALVHDAARHALERHVAGDHAGCGKALAEMEQASTQVLSLIDDLAADLRQHQVDQDFRPPTKIRTPHQQRGQPQPGPLRHADNAGHHEWIEF